MTGCGKAFAFSVFSVLVAFGSTADAADVVVLDSTAPSIGAGDVLPEETQVEIPSGATVTLIMSNGETRLVGGPYQGAIGETFAANSGALEALTTSRGGDTKVLGAVRAPKWEVAD